MKTTLSLLVLLFVGFKFSFAQIATEINDKFIKVARYDNLNDITFRNPSPSEGALVYNNDTHSFWYYNGSLWRDVTNGFNLPLDISTNSGTTLTSRANGPTGQAASFFNSDASNTNSVVAISNHGAGYAVTSNSQGSGGGIASYITNLSTSGYAIFADNYSNSTNGGAIYARSLGNTGAGIFMINNSANTNDALRISTNGSGRAINVESNSGPAGRFTSSTGHALVTDQGNVGIGTSNPATKLEINGNTRILFGNLNLNSGNVTLGSANVPAERLDVYGNAAIRGYSYLEFGKGITTKETNAGKIGYNIFSPTTNHYLDIVGGGSNNLNRRIRLWAEGGTVLEGGLSVAGNHSSYGFTQLGGSDNAPYIKTKKLTVTSSSFAEGVVNVPHGLNRGKIISVTVHATIFGNPSVPPNYTINDKFTYTYNFDDTNVNIYNLSSDCSSGAHICSKPVTIYITYEF